ncbi:serine/arginine-rich splicing factor SC35-like [Hibiscus syriacus]|uniref:serine/arginine-rich splicing factor SC35-like n=1 Tax=Hibiscus syriacus TaxID=106335 RepID=UPI0019230981|nr:serine/arginine-rich splicing factor SC35-like [Hibiscus syriacus]
MESPTLFVDNLPDALHWKGLWQLVGRHGKVKSVFIVSKQSRGGTRFAFVRMDHRDEALEMIEKLSGSNIYGKRIFVGLAKYEKRDRLTSVKRMNLHLNRKNSWEGD